MKELADEIREEKIGVCLWREIIFDILTKLPAKSLSRFRYAYAVASALHGVQHILRKDFMIQPPWDTEIGKTCIIHFTYGCDYALKGELTYDKIGEWRFDKRSYFCGPPPKNLPLPPPVPKVWSLW
ncbi:hypothetical protein MKW98_011538 [Papaver atlanticum]|uniref:Hydroxyproline O-arabinosyltransferase-like domain-containing protein n=1 Tax=Papaver atlanticum TaxID=357466 RepID=A0AAD4XAI2_9MAGN|nr:hypothetical protein MKW98_011538 [Papaver atlanticum]